MNYINIESFKCLLGPQAKNIKIIDNLFLWKVNKTNHFSVQNSLTPENIIELKNYGSSNFHYLTEDNINILKQNFKVSKSKCISIIVNTQNLLFTGNENKSIRHCLNRNKKENFTLETNYRSIKDVESLIEEWSNDYTSRYFRDNSGKNTFFYKNNFHKDLISLFVYDKDDLISFGTLSNPDQNGYSSYVLGKALFKRYYGLSEFTDVELYKLGQTKNIKYVNMGEGAKGVLKYKTKFTHQTQTNYHGNINIL